MTNLPTLPAKRPAEGEADRAREGPPPPLPGASGGSKDAPPPPPPPPAHEEDISHGQRAGAAAGIASGVPRAEGGGKATAGAGAGTVAPTLPARLLVPASAAWFRYSTIHALERQGLPEWFDGRAGAADGAAYKAVRNAVVDAARAGVVEGTGRLSFMAARAALGEGAGGGDPALTPDASALLRLHAFLEEWGIINYQATGAGPPATVATSLPAGVSVDAGARVPGGGGGGECEGAAPTRAGARARRHHHPAPGRASR